MSDTIFALSSGPTESGIGVIRVSGDDAVKVVSTVFEGTDLTAVPTHTVHYGHIVDGTEEIDEVLCIVMRAPRTYTREDTVEIDCHGGRQTEKDIFKVLISAGARPAEPGEFTKRAFLNGRIDLSESEAVMDLIRASSSYARKSALSQLKGSLSGKIRAYREEILHEAAYIEAALDDPDHYDLGDYSIELKTKLNKLIVSMQENLQHSSEGRILRNGIRTAIVGSPNAGKSSVLNVLSGEDRAIVTDVPGTTRDVLEEKVHFGNLDLVLMDTAGIRDTTDAVEKIGVERSYRALSEADLVFFVVDGTKPFSPEDQKILQSLPADVPFVILLNKADLLNQPDPLSCTRICDYLPENFDRKRVLSVSAKTGEGFDRLSLLLQEMFFAGGIPDGREGLLSNERQIFDFRNALHALQLVVQSIDDGLTEDFYSSDLMDAYRNLGYIIGEEVSDDLVDRIFSEFCMGK